MAWAFFSRDFWKKRNTRVSPTGMYLPVRAIGDDNRLNAYEALQGPPPMDYAGGSASSGYPVGINPGPEVFAMDYGAPYGFGVAVGTGTGLFETGDIIGGGPIYESPDSTPSQELV